MYDFDTIVNRNTEDDIKYHRFEGIDDLIPMWVADMDFKSPPEVVRALEETARRGIYGYSEAGIEYDAALTGWFKRHYDWIVEPKHVVKIPGVIPGLSNAVRALTEPGGHVMILEPVYGPFDRCVTGNGRKITVEQLRLRDGRYEIDLDDMEKKIREDRVKLLLWCSPHNPVGRVWTRGELMSVIDICRRNNVRIVSDEIHADLVLYGNRHIPMGSLSDDIVTITSPTKTFNIAGIQAANMIIPDRELRERLDREAYVAGTFGLNKMGIAATTAAYKYGDQWLRELISYIEGNVDAVREALKGTELTLIEPEGTYLLWIGTKREDLTERLLYEAHIRVSDGSFFGAGGDGFIRLNVACPRTLLNEALIRIRKIL